MTERRNTEAEHSGNSSSSEPVHPGSGTPLSTELARGTEAIQMISSTSQVSRVTSTFKSLDLVSCHFQFLFFHCSHSYPRVLSVTLVQSVGNLQPSAS